jgi:hypothetical protein
VDASVSALSHYWDHQFQSQPPFLSDRRNNSGLGCTRSGSSLSRRSEGDLGIAGGLWLASIGLLLCAAFAGSQLARDVTSGPHVTPWTNWEIVILAALTFVALFTRVWDLARFPDNIYPDEIMTGTIATQSYINKIVSAPSVFSTVWHGIDLPALWFWIVSRFLKSGWQHSCDAKDARCFIRCRDGSSSIVN